MEEILVHLDKLKDIFKLNKDKDEKRMLDKNLRVLNNKYSYQKKLILSRPSIININMKVKSINMSNKFYLIEDDLDTEDGYNDETKETLPSLIKVSKDIFDPNIIMILTDIKYFPRESEPGLIITGIEDWVKEKHLKIFLKGVPTLIDKNKIDNNKNNNHYNEHYEDFDLDIISIQFFIVQNKRYAYVKLNSIEQMEIIGNFFLNPIKKLYPSFNSKKEKIEVYYAYNLLKLTKNHWYGVILRDLPPNCDDKSIYNFTEQKVKNGIRYCLNPVLIDNSYCTLVVCKELENAEKLCNDLNNSEIKNKYIKAHLHPHICKIRNEDFYADYETFSKNGYLFNNDAEQSEECINFAKPFMEFFYPDYLNRFNNNNKSKKKEEEKNLSPNNANKEKEKILKRQKDLTLASSIFDLINKSKSKEDSKKTNNQNINENCIINNKKDQINQRKDNIIEINNDKLLNINNIKSTILTNQNSKINLDINPTNSKELNSGNNTNFINKKNNNNESIIDKNKNEIVTYNNDKEINNTIKYSQKEIDYYTYNMGDQKYYEEMQRKNYSYKPRNIYKDNYKSFHKNNYFNNEYKNQRYEHISYKTSYKNYHHFNKDREYYHHNHDHFKERSKENIRERSREGSDFGDKNKYRDNREKRNNNYNYNSEWRRDKKWEKERRGDSQKEKERETSRDKERSREWSRDRDWERSRERNVERDTERYWDDRNRRYNDYRYQERNNSYNDRKKRIFE